MFIENVIEVHYNSVKLKKKSLNCVFFAEFMVNDKREYFNIMSDMSCIAYYDVLCFCNSTADIDYDLTKPLSSSIAYEIDRVTFP